MKSPVDEPLRRAAAALRLKFACDDCAHFDDAARACSLGYPNEAHAERDLGRLEVLTFCKAFELV